MNIDINLVHKFREIFISSQNKNYISEIVYSKLTNVYTKDQFDKTDDIYIMQLNSLQTYIFDTFFLQICKDLQKQNKMSIENVIILLNKVTMEHFEHLIHHNINTRNKTEIVPTVSVKNIQTKFFLEEPKQRQYEQEMINKEKQEMINKEKQEIINKEKIELHNKQKELNNKEIELRKLETELENLKKEINKKNLKKSNETVTKYVQTETNSNDILKNENIIKTKEKFKKLEENSEIMTSYHLISNDSEFSEGNYNFNIECNKIKSIHLIRFWMECNMYNINEYNNVFYIYENDLKIKISIPFGYYKIEELVNTIEILLNKFSINKLKYQVFHDHFKNKVFFTCTKDELPVNFILVFENQNIYTPLHKMLGFKLLEYSGNNIYVSENHAKENIFDNIYLRIFLDNQEVCKYIMSNGSSYFECFSLNYSQHFGKGFDMKNEDIDSFDMFENINCKNISIELVDSEGNLIIKPLEFHIVIGVECLE